MTTRHTAHWDDEDTLVLTLRGNIGIVSSRVDIMAIDDEDQDGTHAVEFAADEVAITFNVEELEEIKATVAAIEPMKKSVPA